MPFYIIDLAWFFMKRNDRGRPAAEVLCFYIFQTHTRAENPPLQSGRRGAKSVHLSNLHKVIMGMLRHPFLDFSTPPAQVLPTGMTVVI